METQTSPNGKTVATQFAPATGTTPAPAMPVRRHKRRMVTHHTGGRSTVNLTVNNTLPAYQPVPAAQPVAVAVEPQTSLVSAIYIALAGIALGAVLLVLGLLAGLYLYNLPPVGTLTSVAPATISAPIAPVAAYPYAAGSVDIKYVAQNDLEVVYADEVHPGVFSIAQGSTRLRVTDQGAPVYGYADGRRAYLSDH